MIRLLHRIRLYYDNLKIQTKFTLCILIAVVIPILTLVTIFSGQLYNMVIADTIRNEQEASIRTAPLIENALSGITEAHGQITELPYYQTLFEQPVSIPLVALAQSGDAHSFSGDVAALSEENGISAVRIYVDLPASHAFFSSDTSQDLFLPMSSAKGTYWYGIFQGTKTASLYCPAFYLGNRELEHYGDCAYITAASLRYQGTICPCYVASYYSSESFRQILTDGISFPGGVSYLLNDREAVIASTNDYLSGIYRLSYADIQESLMASNNFLERDVLGERIYVGFYYIRDPEWFMVTVLPSEPLVEKGNSLILRLFAFCLVCIVTAAWIAIHQSRSITNRISSVSRQMTQVRSGQPPVQLPAPVIQDEVGELISTYNYMTEKMNLLIERQRRTAEELRIAELDSLQAQINPHFLYNTMDMINWMAVQGHTSEVSSVIQSLARFYKLTLSRRKNFSTIESELEHVSIYVRLQNMRYQNAIDFVVDMPDELCAYSIPKLTLQPIVENAILHGILEKEEKSGTIVITGWMEDGTIVILVSDDGIGIPAAKLARILSDEPVKSGAGTNIAISNIHRRLKLLYGPDYGLRYSGTEQIGTDVRICLPMLLPDEIEKKGMPDPMTPPDRPSP